jgi:hypothetical protein
MPSEINVGIYLKDSIIGDLFYTELECTDKFIRKLQYEIS